MPPASAATSPVPPPRLYVGPVPPWLAPGPIAAAFRGRRAKGRADEWRGEPPGARPAPAGSAEPLSRGPGVARGRGIRPRAPRRGRGCRAWTCACGPSPRGGAVRPARAQGGKSARCPQVHPCVNDTGVLPPSRRAFPGTSRDSCDANPYSSLGARAGRGAPRLPDADRYGLQGSGLF